MSRPRREWLAPVKGKPSVLLWEQAGEGLHGRVTSRNSRDVPVVGSELPVVDGVPGFNPHIRRICHCLMGGLVSLELERSIAVMYCLGGRKKRTKLFIVTGQETHLWHWCIRESVQCLHPRFFQICHYQAHCFNTDVVIVWSGKRPEPQLPPNDHEPGLSARRPAVYSSNIW